MRNEHARDIEERSAEIAERVIARQYADPFWMERFGADGRWYSVRDTNRTLAYLAQALRFGDAEIFVSYASWLQTVLTTRGMCTQHLRDHFHLLDEEIANAIAARGDARRYLQAASSALEYPAGSAADSLQSHRESIVDEARELLRDAVAPDIAAYDLRYLLSFLADSLALEREDVFEAYIGWVVPFWERAGRPAGYAELLHEALRDSVDVLDDNDRRAMVARLALLRSHAGSSTARGG